MKQRLKHTILAGSAITLPLAAIALLKPEFPTQWLSQREIPDLAPKMPDSEHWLVDKVIDGDTLSVGIDDKQMKLRLCGVDAPELSQPMGAQSHQYLKDLLSKNEYGQVIVIPLETDIHSRTVAELFLQPDPNDGYQPEEEISIISEMLLAGLAYVYPEYVDGCPNGEVMKRAEAIAQEANVGLWEKDYQRPWDYRSSR